MLKCTKEFGDIIRNRRIELGLTQNQLAEQIDVDVRTVLNIENHKGNPKMEILFPLIRSLMLDANVVFYPELSKKQSTLFQFQSLLSDCSDQEIHALFSICQNVLQVFRAQQTISIENK